MTEKGIAFIGFLKSHNWYAGGEDANKNLKKKLNLHHSPAQCPMTLMQQPTSLEVFRVRT